MESMKEILSSVHEGISGLTLLGGEPAAKSNIDMVIEIAREFKRVYPDKTVWCWTGFKLDLSLAEVANGKHYWTGETFQENPSFYSNDLLKYVDVLVDGRWEMENYDPLLLWSGSSNQRVIDVKKSLEVGQIELYSDNNKKD